VVSREQGARSFELRAALPLAKLYRSTGRAADAHAVLAPALAGFSPTPDFPETAKAQTLLAEVANSEEVKKEMGSRQRRLKRTSDRQQWYASNKSSTLAFAKLVRDGASNVKTLEVRGEGGQDD
jgi:hypothetical protein